MGAARRVTPGPTTRRVPVGETGGQPTHAQYQEAITDAAKIFGWTFLHVRKSIGKGRRWTTATNLVGFPDLLLWHSTHGFAAVEVKVGKDRPTAEQTAVLASLGAAGAEVLVAYPKDWDLVLDILKGVR